MGGVGWSSDRHDFMWHLNHFCRWVAKGCLLGWHPKHWGCLSLVRCFYPYMAHPLESTKKTIWKPYMVWRVSISSLVHVVNTALRGHACYIGFIFFIFLFIFNISSLLYSYCWESGIPNSPYCFTSSTVMEICSPYKCELNGLILCIIGEQCVLKLWLLS